MKWYLFPEVNNESGSLMVFALLIAAILTIMGAMLVQDALMESRVARNQAIYQQCLNAAEASALEAAQHMDEVADSAAASGIGAINGLAWSGPPNYDADSGGFVFSADDWQAATVDYANVRDSSLEANVNYLAPVNNGASEALAVYEGSDVLPAGWGLGGGVQTRYTWTIYGRAVHTGAGSSEVIVMLGYRRRI